MLVKVIYQDGKIGEIESNEIDDFIHSKKIKKLQRSGKWVTIGVDPIREVREYYPEVPKREKIPVNKKRKNNFFVAFSLSNFLVYPHL